MKFIFTLSFWLKSFLFGIFIGLLGFACSYLCNRWVIHSTNPKIYNQAKEIPKNDVALLLGTSRYVWNGNENRYFRNRINATLQLFKEGKIKHVIVSGDNHIKSYNEPEDMQMALMDGGIPENKITLDYAGFRTLDSVVRCKKVFKQDKFTIISQEFHNQRALFIAKRYGIDAIAFNAKDVGNAYGRKTMAREYLAKVKAVLDLYILRKKPKFLGKRIDIKID